MSALPEIATEFGNTRIVRVQRSEPHRNDVIKTAKHDYVIEAVITVDEFKTKGYKNILSQPQSALTLDPAIFKKLCELIEQTEQPEA